MATVELLFFWRVHLWGGAGQHQFGEWGKAGWKVALDRVLSQQAETFARLRLIYSVAPRGLEGCWHGVCLDALLFHDMLCVHGRCQSRQPNTPTLWMLTKWL
jgi:hypothetical protein